MMMIMTKIMMIIMFDDYDEDSIDDDNDDDGDVNHIRYVYRYLSFTLLNDS